MMSRLDATSPASSSPARLFHTPQRLPQEYLQYLICDVPFIVMTLQVKYGVVKDGMTHQFFKNSQDPTYSKMWTFMSSNPDLLLASNQDGVEKVSYGSWD